MIGIGALNSGIGNLGFGSSGNNSIGGLLRQLNNIGFFNSGDSNFGFFNSGDTNTGFGNAGFTNTGFETRAAATSVSGTSNLTQLPGSAARDLRTWVSTALGAYNTGSFNSGTLDQAGTGRLQYRLGQLGDINALAASSREG